MVERWRHRLPGGKRQIALGVAVYGSPGFDDPARLVHSLGASDDFRAWTALNGVTLTDEPAGLAELDRHLGGWLADPDIGPRLTNEIGLYVGAVMVRHVPGAVWSIRPNGQPVVRLASEKEISVIHQAVRRCAQGRPRLQEIYSQAGRQ